MRVGNDTDVPHVGVTMYRVLVEQAQCYCDSPSNGLSLWTHNLPVLVPYGIVIRKDAEMQRHEHVWIASYSGYFCSSVMRLHLFSMHPILHGVHSWRTNVTQFCAYIFQTARINSVLLDVGLDYRFLETIVVPKGDCLIHSFNVLTL